jgi:hypothetical protein
MYVRLMEILKSSQETEKFQAASRHFNKEGYKMAKQKEELNLE